MIQFDIKGKTALVTGANRGIGKAFIEYLAQHGARKVYACVRDVSTFDSLLAINQDVVEPVLLDVTQATQVQALASKLTSLDLLINNAGIVDACLASADNALEVARIEMETNYFAPLNLSLALLPLLKQSKGAIVNISSIAGISNFPSISPYSDSKAAIHSLTLGLRAELSQQGILVAGVYPGPIDTRMTVDFEMDKASPSQVAERTFNGIAKGDVSIFPDDFSEAMYAEFLSHPTELEKIFEIGRAHV